jgi:hypothetical protein
MFAVAGLLALNTLAQAYPDAVAIHEAVDNVVRKAAPDFNGQDAIGFTSGEPALVGGRIAQGKTLTWDLQYSNGYYVSIYIACQKVPLMLEAKVRTAQGEVVADSGGVGTSLDLNFVPEPNRAYMLEVSADTSDSVTSTQVAAIIAQVGTGYGQKPDIFGRLARELTASVREIQSMGSSTFSAHKNIYATILGPNQSSGPEVGAVDRFRQETTASVVGSRLTWTSELLDGAEKRVSTGSVMRHPAPRGGIGVSTILNTNRTSIEFARVRARNTGKATGVYMMGFITY